MLNNKAGKLHKVRHKLKIWKKPSGSVCEQEYTKDGILIAVICALCFINGWFSTEYSSRNHVSLTYFKNNFDEVIIYPVLTL